jgi:hypothetical protein
LGRQRILGLRGLKVLSERELPTIPGSDKNPHFAYTLASLVAGYILEISFDTDPKLAPEMKGKGIGWISEHILTTSPTSGYLRGGNDEIVNLHIGRVVELGELLYNLQTVGGVHSIFRRLFTDPLAMEATVLELEGLRLLWLAKLSFRMIDSAAKGEEGHKRPECEIALPSGVMAICEMKCKLETTEFSESSVASTLNTARSQLPKDRCGIVFLKIPISWADTGDLLRTVDVVERVFRSTKRISEVLIYSRDLFLTETHSVHPMLFREVLNKSSPYVSALDGGLIKDRIETAGYTGWLNFSILTSETLKQLLEVELGPTPPGNS